MPVVFTESLRCSRSTAGPERFLTIYSGKSGHPNVFASQIIYPNAPDMLFVRTDATGDTGVSWDYVAPVPQGGPVSFLQVRAAAWWNVFAVSLGFPLVAIEASAALVGPFGELPIGSAILGEPEPVSVLAPAPGYRERYAPMSAVAPVPAIAGAQFRLRFRPVITRASGVAYSFAILNLEQRVFGGLGDDPSGAEIDLGLLPQGG